MPEALFLIQLVVQQFCHCGSFCFRHSQYVFNSLSPTLSITHTLSPSDALACTYPPTHTHTCTFISWLFLVLFPSHSRSLCHLSAHQLTLSVCLTLSHTSLYTHTHALACTLSLSLSHSLAHSLHFSSRRLLKNEGHKNEDQEGS